MKRRKLRKSIYNFSKLIDKNRRFIRRIVLSEDMVDQLYQHPDLINIGIKKDDDGAETWFLFGVESVVSQFVLKNCILEMLNGEIIKVEGFSI